MCQRHYLHDRRRQVVLVSSFDHFHHYYEYHDVNDCCCTDHYGSYSYVFSHIVIWHNDTFRGRVDCCVFNSMHVKITHYCVQTVTIGDTPTQYIMT
jgi:hypothetical protein